MQQCTTLSGSVHYAPTLKKAAGAVSETITGTISGCSGQNGAQAGEGTFVIDWPASSGLNPTTRRISTVGPNAGVYLVQGQDTGGAYASAVLSSSLVVTGQTLAGKKLNQVAAETFVNTLPLQLKINFG